MAVVSRLGCVKLWLCKRWLCKRRLRTFLSGVLCLPLLVVVPTWADKLVSPTESVQVGEAFVRGLPPGQRSTVAFFVLTNSGERQRVLIGVEAEVAERAEIHQHSHEQGIMRMRQVAQVEIAAGASTRFESGGYHIMLFELKRSLHSGEEVLLHLSFADGSRLPVRARVRSVLDEAWE